MTRVLIVDDQPVFRMQLRRLLQRAGLDVIAEAGDIPTAEALVRSLRPDLAVVDVMLPGVNGLAGAPRLRALLPGLRIILISAYANGTDTLGQAARATGAETFVAKDDLDLSMIRNWAIGTHHTQEVNMSVNLVVGATGMVGSEVCRRLVAQGKEVRALVRTSSDPIKVSNLRAMGVQAVLGDLRDRASLEIACKGVETVISTASSMPFSYAPGENDIRTTDLVGEMSLVDAARAAKVRHFVYTSFSGNLDLDFPLRNAKRAVEKHLRQSSMAYTILRPSCFMEVWLSAAVGFDSANAKAVIYGDGSKPLSWIALGDVAAFAAASLENPAARNATLELGGPEPLTPLQVVKIFEQARGRSFEVQFVPVEALAAQQAAAADPMQQSFSGLMRCYAAGDPIDMRETLKAFPVALTSVQDYAGRVRA